MPVVFPVAVGLLALLGAIGALMLGRIEKLWLRNLIESLTHPQGSIVKRIAMAPVATLFSSVIYVEHYVKRRLNAYAAGALPLLTRHLNGVASALHWTYKEYGEIASSWANDFAFFRHRTLPREINRKVLPVKATATHAGELAGRVGVRERANSKRLGHGIDRLKRETGLLAGILLGIDILVRGRHAPAHHRAHTVDIPRVIHRDIPRLKARERAHTKDLADHRTRIKRIEKVIGALVGGLVVYRVLARVAPWLFCRNWKVLGRAICGMRPDSLANLLALLVGAWALSDLRRTARLAEDALGFATDLIWDAAQIGDRPSGRFTID